MYMTLRQQRIAYLRRMLRARYGYQGVRLDGTVCRWVLVILDGKRYEDLYEVEEI